jgi:hypothetical protein
MDTATRKLSEVTVAAPTLLGKILIKAGTQPCLPNAGHQARLKAGARDERTLEAVAWMPLLGA